MIAQGLRADASAIGQPDFRSAAFCQGGDDGPGGATSSQNDGRAAIRPPVGDNLPDIVVKARSVGVVGVKAAGLEESEGVGRSDPAGDIGDLGRKRQHRFLVGQCDVDAAKPESLQAGEARCEPFGRHPEGNVVTGDVVALQPVAVQCRRSAVGDRPADDAGETGGGGHVGQISRVRRKASSSSSGRPSTEK